MARDYNFWVYIIANKNRAVLYTGMIDDLIRRVGEHRAREIPALLPVIVAKNWFITSIAPMCSPPSSARSS